MILPERVFGRSAVNRTASGLAIAPIFSATCVRSTCMRSSVGSFPSRRVTNAAIAWPFSSCPFPTTAASASPGWGDVAAASAAAAQAKPAATGGAPSWAEVAAASQTAAAQPAPRTKKRRKPKPQEPLFQPDPLPGQKQKDLSYLEEPQPEIGDFVLHKQFGKCKVERIGEDGGLVIKTAGGRRRAIKLTVLEVLPPHEDNQGRMVYPVQPRRR